MKGGDGGGGRVPTSTDSLRGRTNPDRVGRRGTEGVAWVRSRSARRLSDGGSASSRTHVGGDERLELAAKLAAAAAGGKLGQVETAGLLSGVKL